MMNQTIDKHLKFWRLYILWKGSSFLPQPLYETSIVKSSTCNIWVKLFQGIRYLGPISILEKGITKNALSINLLHTICSYKNLKKEKIVKQNAERYKLLNANNYHQIQIVRLKTFLYN